jgi:protein-disulfide isomerase
LYGPIVDRDIAEAQGLGVSATPTFFINGRKLVGAQDLSAFTAIVDEELGISKKSVPSRDHDESVDLRKARLDGAPVRGAPEAPVTIVEFSDFQCPFCAAVRPTLEQLLREYPGQVRLVFKHFPLEFHENAPLAHQAALAAGEQGKFWEMHDQIFANQRAMKRDDLIRTARDLGLNMDRFVADIDSSRFISVVDADKEEGARIGVNGTPSFVINGRFLEGARPLADFRKIIEEALHLASATRETVEMVESNAARGPTDAPVRILWFSDLQSPLALTSAQLVQEAMSAFPGKIHILFKHFPLGFHADAFLAHEAALAAGAQGKFWEMQEIIIRNQKALKEQDLLRYASLLGLDSDKFEKALSERTYRGLVESDMAEGQRRNVRGAPVFFINGKRIDGLQAFGVFEQTIEEELRRINVATQ